MEREINCPDEVANFLVRAHRRRVIRIVAGIVLLPLFVIASYVGSLAMVILAEAAGVKGPANYIPRWYVAPMNSYLMNQGPGWLSIIKFSNYCSWHGEAEHVRTWEEEWSEIERDIAEQLKEQQNEQSAN